MAATGDIASTLVAEHSRPHSRKTMNDIDATQLDGATAEKKLHQETVQPNLRASLSGAVASSDDATLATPVELSDLPKHTEPFENGYHFPPKYPWMEATKFNLAAFWKFFITPMGFFWTIYGLNVVAWGGMLFLLLCNASPAMCYPTCDDIDSPRRKWVEYDSQVLTALFCVTAFGLAPWRFRDLYYSLQYRLQGKQSGIRRLAGIHRGWFRLPGSQDLPVDVGPDNVPEDTPEQVIPIPESSIPNAPLTGVRAPATLVWKMDFVIWTMVLNTFAQCGLCGIMWGQNRYDRPGWSTGFLVAVGSIVAMVGGYVIFLEGKNVKSIEGVACSERDLKRLASDKELGIHHYNNIKDKKPKKKELDPEARREK
ncbi:hypothetical protein B0H67DRAFT_646675 [Lasiosphaeris hirsuta]|uniref:Uncharacterized protein n=1 Tax=Lasiosphaeris hirsuta TaxID=260670 RepID=A0AA40A8J2_9PEZI|nr:hypothetical protein B0H67DRAFT_646675 [Lasiosphaeris hirsuta]